MRFVLFVEGQTEEMGVAGFLKRGIDPYFQENIGITTVGFEGWSELRDNTPKKAAIYLTDPKYADVIAVVSLLDLYGPDFYPASATSTKERYASGQKYMKERVAAHFRQIGLDEKLAAKYHHFFAVHETEAWLVAQPTAFRAEIRKSLEAGKKAPEEINSKTPPSKLLQKLHMEKFNRRYQKTTNARIIFPKLEVSSVSAACPYLNQMLVAMRHIAVQAGAKPVTPVDQ